MKKILFLLAMTFMAFQASAQGFHLIPKVGINLAKVTKADVTVKPGVNVGLAGEFMITQRFGIEPGVFFSMQGYKSEMGHVKLNYINIPVYAKLYVLGGLFAFAGPQVGFNVAAKEDGNSIKDVIHTADFTLGLGAGYQTKLGLMLSANYNVGLTNVGEELKNKSGVWQINLGWRF